MESSILHEDKTEDTTKAETGVEPIEELHAKLDARLTGSDDSSVISDHYYDSKQRHLAELDEKLAIRLGQIERAERRLLSLQQQLFGATAPSGEAFSASPSPRDMASEVLRVDTSRSDPLRIDHYRIDHFKLDSMSTNTIRASDITSVSPNSISPSLSAFHRQYSSSPLKQSGTFVLESSSLTPSGSLRDEQTNQSSSQESTSQESSNQSNQSSNQKSLNQSTSQESLNQSSSQELNHSPNQKSTTKPKFYETKILEKSHSHGLKSSFEKSNDLKSNNGLTDSVNQTPSRHLTRSSSSISPAASPSNSSMRQLFGFKSNTITSSTESPASKSVQPSSISFTLLKSWFTGSNSNSSINFTLDASQVQICEKIHSLCTPDFDFYRANVGGWGCNVKLMSVHESESRYFKRVKLLEELPTHPNIARYWFHDIDRDHQCCRIFTEWFQTNLTEVIENKAASGKRFTPQQIEHILLEIVKGMEFLHSYSILHRNICPSNIHVLFDDGGELSKISIANLDMAKVITKRVNTKGTAAAHDPRYCAPEVLSAKITQSSYSFPSDVWSFGMITYSLLTLQKPWHDTYGATNLSNLIQSGERPPIAQDIQLSSEYRPFIDLYHECTRKLPEDRPSISAIRQALTTKLSINDHRKAAEMNIGFTYQPKRESSTFFEHFLVIGCPIGGKKPEQIAPKILFQYPSADVYPLSNPDMIINFAMAHAKPVQRLRRSNSMSEINEKIFASRDVIERSSSACIFTMMEGEELRYGVCVFFEEPVDIVPSFMSTQKVIEDSKTDPQIDVKKIGKSPACLSTPNFKKKNLQNDKTSSTFSITASPNTTSKPRRGHQRNASEGGQFKPTSAFVPPPNLGHVKFTHRCYMFFTKWPFFKLHFEILWAILAQERLTRIMQFTSKPTTRSTPSSTQRVGPLKTKPRSTSLVPEMTHTIETLPTLSALQISDQSSSSSQTHQNETSDKLMSNPNPVENGPSTAKLSPVSPRKLVVTDSRGVSIDNAKEHSNESTSSHSSNDPTPTEENCNLLKMLSAYHKNAIPMETKQTSLLLPSHPEPFVFTPGNITESVAEWCFPCLFRVLSVKTLVKLFEAVLLEEKIVVISPDTGILTACVTGITSMLRPYAWQGAFLPIVPSNMETVLESPVPYVAGMRHRPTDVDEFGADEVIVEIARDSIFIPHAFPRLPASDKITDAFNAYANAVNTTASNHNPCKTTVSDANALVKILEALGNWHSYLIEQIAAVPHVGLDFDWGNEKQVEALIKGLPSSDREFYRTFVTTQHFSIYSNRVNATICQIRSKKDNQKRVEKLETIFV